MLLKAVSRTKEASTATERSEQAKAKALAGYRNPGPRHLNCAQAETLSSLLLIEQDPELTSVAGHLGGGMVRMDQAA